MDEREVAARLDEIASSAAYEVNLSDALNGWRDAGSLAAEQADCLAQIFGFSLSSVAETDRREADGGPFGAMYSFGDAQWPQPLSEIPDRCLSYAAQVVEFAEDPMVVARISDLLWTRRFGDTPHKHAEGAVAAYLRFPSRVATHLPSFTNVQMAERALEISLQLNNKELRQACRDVLFTVSRDSLEEDDPGIGVVARGVGALLRLPPAEVPGNLDQMLIRAGEVFGDDPWAAQAVYELRIELAKREPERRGQLERAQTDGLLSAAETAPNVFLKHRFLEEAISLLHARNAPAEEINAVARLIEESPVGPEDFVTITSEVDLPAGVTDAFLETPHGRPTWRHALEWFGMQGPPTGNPTRNAERAEAQKRETPLQFLLPKKVYGSGGLPDFQAEGDDELMRHAIVENERLQLAVWGELYLLLLERVVQRPDFPEREELREFFASPTTSASSADAVARALGHFRRGDYDEAAHILVPRIEAMVRGLAQGVGITTFSVPDNRNPGGFVSLGVLFDRFRPPGLPDEGWLRYGEHLLTDRNGRNLRNEIAHGLIPTVSASDVALLIHYACHLNSLRVPPRGDTDDPTAGAPSLD